MGKHQLTQMGIIKKVIRRIGRYRILMLLSLLLATTVVAITLYIPILAGKAIDCIITQGAVDFNTLISLLIRIGILAGEAAILQWIMNTVNNHITYNVVRDVRNEAFSRIQILPLSFLDRNPTGEILNRITTDADQFADGLLMGFTQLFTGIATIIGTLLFMLSVNWKIAIVVVVLTPLSLFVAKFIASKTYHFFLKQSKVRAEQTAFIDEMITGAKTVTAFSREDETLEKFDEINERLEKCSLKATFFSSLTNPTTRFINSTIYAAVALTGAFAASGLGIFGVGAVFTVGQLSSLLAYANQYTKPFNEISGVITELQNAIACAGRLFELIEQEPQPKEADTAVSLTDISGNIDIKDVAFSYTPDRPLISGLSLNVKPGQRIAIVGPTGCGKTTFINLLMRFYDVCDGSITLEGHDIRNITRKSLRLGFGMVLQDTWLRAGTIKDNIKLAKSDATDEEVITAAKSAHAHSFIKRLPNGYDTLISEDGGSLSQGQKQLLCIARIMLCMPPMLILDEATSSIDTRTEIRIQKAFLKLLKGRTSFIVAHRLSTIREADIILVMRDGNIVEQGNHQELLQKNGFYATLYNSQFANQE